MCKTIRLYIDYVHKIYSINIIENIVGNSKLTGTPPAMVIHPSYVS